MISAHGRGLGLGTPGVVAKDDGDCAEERRAQKQTQLDRVTIDEGVRDLVHQFREFLIALCLSPGRQGLALLTTGTVLVVCATAAAQVGLNAWNRPFYEAISARDFVAFSYQLVVFAAIAGGLLVLNVAQASASRSAAGTRRARAKRGSRPCSRSARLRFSYRSFAIFSWAASSKARWAGSTPPEKRARPNASCARSVSPPRYSRRARSSASFRGASAKGSPSPAPSTDRRI